MLKKIFQGKLSKGTNNVIASYNKAIDWITNNTVAGQGIAISSRNKIPFPEVTGYFIPTLIDLGEFILAEQYAEFLSYMQLSNGAFTGPDGKEYVFDSGQALRGLLAAGQYWERFKPVAARAADYIVSSTEKDGRIPSIYGEEIPEYVHVYILPALDTASRILENPEYHEVAEKSLLYYKNTPGVLSINCLTHFLAYIMDGFIDMGEADFVRSAVEMVFSKQLKNGGIPAFPGVKWTCSAGNAQFAVIGYKIGMDEKAGKALDFLCGIQNPTGGFYGSYGRGARYFPDEEVSWTNKFFLDAVHLKIRRFFDSHADIFPKEVSSDDGRLEAVLGHLGEFMNKRILDAGMGKGRFASKIKDIHPSCEVHGVDISGELLKQAPSSIIKKRGSILNLPYDPGTFDGVFCIEALEHAIRTEKAIEELCRVLKENGRIIIIDKNVEMLGRMETTDFEQWFDRDEVRKMLERYCRDVRVKEISYDERSPDGLFLAWTGIKRGALVKRGEE